MNELNKEGIRCGIETGCDLWFMFGKVSPFMIGAYIFCNFIIYSFLGIDDIKKKRSTKEKTFFNVSVSVIEAAMIGFFKYLFLPIRIALVALEILGIAIFLKSHLNGRTMTEEIKSWPIIR